ncbi:hypothetical protein K439DRAFT_1611330 [Ramaria rubella]|nr:hypothetical protein K439DRAFT_1611330 [Ramaria rubella]
MNRSLRCGSDHYALTFEIDHGSSVIDNIYGVKYNYKKADPAAWQSTFKMALATRQPSFDTLLLAHPSTAQLEDAAVAFHDCLVMTAEAEVLIRKTSHRARPWWTKELNDIRKHMLEDENDFARQIEDYGQANKHIIVRTKKCTNFFKRQIRKAKKKWADETLLNVESKDIWGLRMWSSGNRTYPAPAISRGAGLPPAVQHKDKCNALWEELFQPPPPLPFNFPDLTHSLEGDLDWSPLT